MSAPGVKVDKDTPTAGDLQMAIHALDGIFAVLDWIESEEVGAVSEHDLGEARVSLVIAGKLITEDFRRRF